MEPDPPIEPEDPPSEAEWGQIALALLRELAATDPEIAARMRELGIE